MGGWWSAASMTAGGLAGFLAVALSAVAAHALPARLDPRAMAAVRSAIDMQGWHALALLAVGLFLARAAGVSALLARAAACGFGAGLLLFSGSIYLAELGGVRLGVAPVGGVLLMLGWLLLAAAAMAGARGA